MESNSEDIIQVPVGFATNLKCIVCSGYLSVPPIVSGNNGKNVCGRCDFITYNKQERRNVIYEDVAKLMSFPCIFDKCSKKIPWGEVEKHEKVCPYHTIVCPKKDCHENVLVRELVAHFTWHHKFQKASSITVTQFDINEPDFDSPQLLICREKPYLCFSYKSDSFIGISVYSLDPLEDENIKYFAALTSNNGILIKGRQKILPFNGRIHCADCFESKCVKKHHKYSLNYKNNLTQELHNSLTTKFEIDSVKKILEADKVTFKVALSDTGVVYPGGVAKKRKIGDISGKESECDTCKTLLGLPEMSRKLGISLMDAIKEQIKQCPCNSDIKDILDDFDVMDIMEEIKEENVSLVEGKVTNEAADKSNEVRGGNEKEMDQSNETAEVESSTTEVTNASNNKDVQDYY